MEVADAVGGASEIGFYWPGDRPGEFGAGTEGQSQGNHPQLRYPEAMGQIEALTPPTMVQQFTQIPVLGVMPYAENLLDAQALAKVAANWHLEQLVSKEHLRPQAPLSQ